MALNPPRPLPHPPLSPCERAFIKHFRKVCVDVNDISDHAVLAGWHECYTDWLAACQWAWACPEEEVEMEATLRMLPERMRSKWRWHGERFEKTLAAGRLAGVLDLIER